MLSGFSCSDGPHYVCTHVREAGSRMPRTSRHPIVFAPRVRFSVFDPGSVLARLVQILPSVPFPREKLVLAFAIQTLEFLPIWKVDFAANED